MIIKVYLSGQMTGLPDYNFPEFNRVAALLRQSEYFVFNPAEHGCDPEYSWADYMRMNIADLVKADLVATLPNWKNSKGARLEVHIAKELDMPVVSYSELL